MRRVLAVLRPLSYKPPMQSFNVCRALASVACGLALLSACDKGNTVTPDSAPAEPPATQAEVVEPAEEAAPKDTLATLLRDILAAPHRSDENRARDEFRHPAQTIEFFGVTPQSTVVELWPGGGWYTEILAPLLRDEGTLIVTSFDPNGEPAYYGTKQAIALKDLIANQPEIFGKVVTAIVGVDIELDKKGKVKKTTLKPDWTLAPESSVDIVLTFRNSHGWFNNGQEDLIYGKAFAALKPGGVFGVVQHRANAGEDPKKSSKNGYLPEAAVIASAEKAGFKLAEKSEINANAKDTKDYEKGVWTLPPRLALEDKDRDRYLEIGESDRMTLKFVKPE